MKGWRGGAGHAALLFSCGYEDVVAVGPEALHGSEFDQPAGGTAAGEHSNDLDGLGDQRTWHGDDGFLNELLEAAQRAEGCAGVQGAHTTGMAGAPGLQEVQRLS